MKSSEFLKEEQSLIQNAVETLPSTFVFPGLPGQDAYAQYRFGVALAAARAMANGDIPKPEDAPMGENLVVIARSEEEEEQLMMALRLFGKSGSGKRLASPTSDEPKDTNTRSPGAPQYSRKLRKE